MVALHLESHTVWKGSESVQLSATGGQVQLQVHSEIFFTFCRYVMTVKNSGNNANHYLHPSPCFNVRYYIYDGYVTPLVSPYLV